MKVPIHVINRVGINKALVVIHKGRLFHNKKLKPKAINVTINP
jgi:hypothetical protein